MTAPKDLPFDTLESALEFMCLLDESIGEAREDIERDLTAALDKGEEREIRAVTLAIYKVDKLKLHVQSSRRLLNDLRMLRRLYFEERRQVQSGATVAASSAG